MKKIRLPLILVFAVLFSFSAHAAGGKLSAVSPSGKVGEQIELRVRLDNPGIIATRIFVHYDKSVLRLDRAENGDVFEEKHALFGKDLTASPYILLWDDSLATVNNTKSGTLFTLKLTVLKGTTNGQTAVKLQVDGGSTFDAELNPVSVAGCTAYVHVPTVSETTKPTSPAAKPTAATTSTTAKVTTTKATTTATTKATTTRLTASVATTKPVSASTAPIQSQTVQDVPQSAPTDGTPTAAQQNAPAEEAVAKTNTAQTSDALTEPATALDPTEPTQTGTAAPEENTPSRSPLLWLLLLVPVGIALVLLLKKKKHE